MNRRALRGIQTRLQIETATSLKLYVPISFFAFVYAQLHSLSYRKRYAEFLRRDFPRVFATPYPDLFHSLNVLGSSLLAFHTLDFDLAKYEAIPFIQGSLPLSVEKVAYDGDVVWLDKGKSKGVVGISEKLWNFRIGSYCPLEKWLKDRQAKGGKNPRPGRKLTKEDIEHYQKMVVAIRETIRLMGEIDEVIDQHGGWPDAFVTEPIELDSADKEPKLPFA